MTDVTEFDMTKPATQQEYNIQQDYIIAKQREEIDRLRREVKPLRMQVKSLVEALQGIVSIAADAGVGASEVGTRKARWYLRERDGNGC